VPSGKKVVVVVSEEELFGRDMVMQLENCLSDWRVVLYFVNAGHKGSALCAASSERSSLMRRESEATKTKN
jgi:hypothetical protein